MIDRREFLILAAAGAAAAGGAMAALTKGSAHGEVIKDMKKSRVSLVRTGNRETGVPAAIDLLNINPVKGKAVMLKPNFNTEDPFPASTHNGTLTALMAKLKAMGARDITIGERSGPPDTKDVLRAKGIFALADRHGARVMNFEELAPEDWVRVRPEGSHWRDGFDAAKPVLEAECVVSTCCLKTHAYGGVFTMSLKLSVGMVHKRNMTELHTSVFSMRKMIAEINTFYSPSLILMDGIEAFTDGGPSRGDLKRANVMVAGEDRVAVDAVGVAILKYLGSNVRIMSNKIFRQGQIERAVELGLGAGSPGEIELVTGDPDSRAYADKIKEILMKG